MLFFLIKEAFKFFLSNLLFFNQKFSAGVEHIVVFANDMLGLRVTLIHNPLYLAVDGVRHLVAIALGMGQITADEYFVLVPAVLNREFDS